MRETFRRCRKIWMAALLLALTAALGGVAAANREAEVHRIVIQINSDDLAPMKHAVSNTMHLITYYRRRHEAIKVAIVAYGRGIDMFRSDATPLHQILEYVHAHFPEVSYQVCGNTKAIMEKQEGHPLTFIAGTRVVPSGIVQIVKLEEAGWSYIRE